LTFTIDVTKTATSSSFMFSSVGISAVTTSVARLPFLGVLGGPDCSVDAAEGKACLYVDSRPAKMWGTSVGYLSALHRCRMAGIISLGETWFLSVPLPVACFFDGWGGSFTRVADCVGRALAFEGVAGFAGENASEAFPGDRLGCFAGRAFSRYVYNFL
jgi:hypothetical protein